MKLSVGQCMKGSQYKANLAVQLSHQMEDFNGKQKRLQ